MAQPRENFSRNLFKFSLLLARSMSVAALELLRAAASGDLNRLRALLAQGISINSTNNANQTALILAVAFKQIEIVKYLVAAGADVKIQDQLGLTAIDWAQRDARIIQLLNGTASQQPALVQSPRQSTNVLEGVAGAILRDHTSTFAAPRPTTATKPAPTNPYTVKPPAAELSSDTSGPGSSAPIVDSGFVVDNIQMPRRAPMSPTIRTLYRICIVVCLLAGAFLNYHLAASVVSTLTSNRVKPDPAPIPVNAAAKPTKSAPKVSNELSAAELYVPDAEYPPDATVASGNVNVRVQVSQKGIVVKAEAVDGDESLRGAAEKAALTSAFDPDKIQSDSSVNGTITYSFLKPDDVKRNDKDFGLIGDAAVTPNSVSATAGGPLAGAERKLVVPKIPKWVTVQQKSATVVVRVNHKAGRVMSWRSLDADDRLRSYLIKAARSSTFNPDKLPGDTNVVGIITYKFQ